MPRNLSAEAFKAMFASETEQVFLMCLVLEHADLGTPIRVVHNNEDITRTAGVFSACFFDINLPEEAPGTVPQVTLTIENVDRTITDAVRNLQGRVKVTLDVVMASSPNTVEAGPFEFYMLSANFNTQFVQGRLGFEDDILNMGFPKDAYTPVTAPGLFRG
jgi:Domain of unknown function (DUF1833)